jgi:hypothetical protein
MRYQGEGVLVRYLRSTSSSGGSIMWDGGFVGQPRFRVSEVLGNFSTFPESPVHHDSRDISKGRLLLVIIKQ